MTKLNLTLPAEFANLLEHAPPIKDLRTDAQIISAVAKFFEPVTSEKNIWAFWHAGAEAMPGWCQRNVCNWVRLCGPSWTVRVLDTVPSSPNYALKHVPRDLFPTSFVEGSMSGQYAKQHSADFCRGAYLYQHGGAWLDVGIFLFRNLDALCWNKLEDSTSPHQICVPWMYENSAANGFVACRRQDPFIKRWHELFLHLWECRRSFEGLSSHPLLEPIKELDYRKATRRGFLWEFQVDAEVTFSYLAQVLAWMRLSSISDCGDDEHFNAYKYWLDHSLLLDALTECYPAENEVGFHSELIFNLLKMKTDDDSLDAMRAHRMVWRMLSRSSYQTVAHGKNIWRGKSLGALFDETDDDAIDLQEGTFAELLRYGPLYFRQKREIDYIPPPKLDSLLQKGLYEA